MNKRRHDLILCRWPIVCCYCVIERRVTFNQKKSVVETYLLERQKSEDEHWKCELALEERKIALEERKLKLEEDKLKFQQQQQQEIMVFPPTPICQ